MLKKLFHYDFKAMSRTLFPFTLATLGCGVVLFLSIIVLSFAPEDGALSVLLPILFGTLTVFSGLGIFLVPVASEFFILHRYYKNFFTDEGYLTFALPATMEEHLHSKILSGMLWTLLSCLAAVAALFIGAFLPSELLSSGNGMLLSVLSMLFSDFTQGVNEIYFLVLTVLTVLVSLISQLILFYTAITLGSLFMSKHKIIGSVLFYFVANTIISVFSSIFSTIFTIASAISENIAFMIIMSLASAIIVNIAVAVIGYFIILSMLKKRLNLE